VGAGACHARQNVANHRLIEEHAASWLVRRESGHWTPEDADALAHWLSQDTAHRVAFLRLEAVDEETRRLRVLGAGLDSAVVPPVGQWQQSPFFDTPPEQRNPRSRVWYPAVAALLLMALTAGAAFWLMRPIVRANEYVTQVGGLESVSLHDGSGVTLNTATRLRVELRAHERRIELQEGEAYFKVAKDPGRPFVVEAGDMRVVAVGTQFAVRRENGDVRVIVTEGSVNLQGDRSAHLTAGTVARTRGADILVQKEAQEDLQAMVSWRDGRLTFRDTTLADAVAELNRYNARQIEIGDSTLGVLRVSGSFRPTHYDAFVRLLREGYSIRVVARGDKLILTQN
jgi:transmembrane sensor